MVEYTVAFPDGATVYTCQPMPLTRADISSMVGEYTCLERTGPTVIVAGKERHFDARLQCVACAKVSLALTY